eukprot:TRINITY_DN2201_c1_g1_i1.p1 TRINITY_DN2201_c1_g1~~TRINITY_DN2201_c1_g1_i1.p1  ORF type:complete len:517 (+),score=208.24 TRINITY_DN2201_c1_g1_i1:196-1746(+)
MQRNAQDHRKAIKSGINSDDSRRKREDQRTELRKAQRGQELMQKRRLTTNPSSMEAPEVADFTMANNGNTLAQHVAFCHSGDLEQNLQGATAIRKLLSIQNNPPIAEVIQSGVVPRLVQLLGSSHPKVRVESAWALTNIASGTSQQTLTVVENNAVPAFVYLLNLDDDEIVDQSIWALGNIAGDSHQCRDLVLKHGIVAPLIRILTNPSKKSIHRNATWCLSNLCRGKPQPPPALIAPALPILARLIHDQDSEILIDACWALSYLSDGDDAAIQSVVNAGVAPRLVELLTAASHTVQTPALRAIGNIVSGNEHQTQVILDLQTLPAFYQLLMSQRRALKKEAAWAISNVCAGSRDQCQTIFSANIFPRIIHLYKSGDFDVKKECAWAVSNALSWKIPGNVRTLVEAGVIPAIVDMMKAKDNKMVIVALESLEQILKVGEGKKNGMENIYKSQVEEAEGIDALEELQQHISEEIYKKALNLLETYFAGEDENENQQAVTSNGSFAFGSVATPSTFAF